MLYWLLHQMINKGTYTMPNSIVVKFDKAFNTAMVNAENWNNGYINKVKLEAEIFTNILFSKLEENEEPMTSEKVQAVINEELEGSLEHFAWDTYDEVVEYFQEPKSGHATLRELTKQFMKINTNLRLAYAMPDSEIQKPNHIMMYKRLRNLVSVEIKKILEAEKARKAKLNQ